jgi:hypothetical protein
MRMGSGTEGFVCWTIGVVDASARGSDDLAGA